ncbi:hypothetical protein TNCV_205901 [Trichonephila clavipes]|nr:hypothetical protein TNCV_205901 [Trichonephila clavipes]
MLVLDLGREIELIISFYSKRDSQGNPRQSHLSEIMQTKAVVSRLANRSRISSQCLTSVKVLRDAEISLAMSCYRLECYSVEEDTFDLKRFPSLYGIGSPIVRRLATTTCDNLIFIHLNQRFSNCGVQPLGGHDNTTMGARAY